VLLAPLPNPKLEGYPLSAVRDFLFNIFTGTLRMWRIFLHPQPEDAPCRGDKRPIQHVMMMMMMMMMMMIIIIIIIIIIMRS
jgi:hypothetical protein